jgi:hypothetical protein
MGYSPISTPSYIDIVNIVIIKLKVTSGRLTLLILKLNAPDNLELNHQKTKAQHRAEPLKAARIFSGSQLASAG